MANKIRVRFAPSPTGYMHLGNVRAALMNYLFAKQKQGTFILRIEDTDNKRNIDEAFQQIIYDLKWLHLDYLEGPLIGGKFKPYFQSQRASKYQQALEELTQSRKAYRCFCTAEKLEQKREQQRKLGLPPRYDRTCLHLSNEKIKQKVEFGKKFIWRFLINEHQVIDIKDMAKGTVTFEMKNYGDFALTRQDGSATFTFANFVDDWLMKISHVIRGQDHLSNTAYQAALYDAFAVKIPTFWHLPIICNSNGVKMSKRDFGFTLQDLKKAGYLPQAILNYLATIGSSFKEEIQSINQLIQNFNFEKISSGGNIHYDIEKLLWINHKWIKKLTPKELLKLCKPILHEDFSASKTCPDQTLSKLISLLQPELKTLNDIKSLAKFYFDEPLFDKKIFKEILTDDKGNLALDIINKHIDAIKNPDTFIKQLKISAKEKNLSIKEIFMTLRYILAGTFSGIGIKDLVTILDQKKIKDRIEKALK